MTNTPTDRELALRIYQLFSGLDEYASERDQKRMETAVAMSVRSPAPDEGEIATRLREFARAGYRRLEALGSNDADALGVLRMAEQAADALTSAHRERDEMRAALVQVRGYIDDYGLVGDPQAALFIIEQALSPPTATVPHHADYCDLKTKGVAPYFDCTCGAFKRTATESGR